MSVALDAFADWYEMLNTLIEAYDNTPDLSNWAPSKVAMVCKCEPRPRETEITKYGFTGRQKTSLTSCRKHLAKVLFTARLFPVSTKQTQAAISIPFMRHFQALRKHSAVGTYNLSQALEDQLQDDDPEFTLSTYFRRQLMAASMWYQATQVYAIDQALYGRRRWVEARPKLHNDDLVLTTADLASSCPACFGKFYFEDRHHIPREKKGDMSPQLIVSVDGNFSHKRKRKENVADKQPLPPRRFLSQRQVHEVEKRLKAVNLSAKATANQHDCTAKVKAADPLAAKGAAGPHDITGVMGLCCRHDHPLIFCDITSPGERHHYAVALVLALLGAIKHRVDSLGVMYDIGCRFANNKRVAALMDPAVKIIWTIPLFHVYGHTTACQVRYSPRRVKGMGWCDGEGMERVWSGISNMISSARSMSQVTRRFTLEERFEHLVTQRQRSLWQRMRKRLSDMRGVEAKCYERLRKADASEEHLRRVLGDGTIIPRTRMPDGVRYIKQGHFDVLAYMSRERQHLALQLSGIEPIDGSAKETRSEEHDDESDAASSEDDQSEANTESDTGSDGAESDGSVDIESTDELAPKGIRKSQDPTAQLADTFFRSLSNYLNFGAQIKERKGERNSTAQMGRLAEAMKLEKGKTTKAYKKLDSHLLKTCPRYKSLDKKLVFTEQTRHWASIVATNGSIEMPWWAEYENMKIVHAFDHVLRIGEERDRMVKERGSMRYWADARIVGAGESNSPTRTARSVRMTLGRMRALRLKWFREREPMLDDDGEVVGPRGIVSGRSIVRIATQSDTAREGLDEHIRAGLAIEEDSDLEDVGDTANRSIWREGSDGESSDGNLTEGMEEEEPEDVYTVLG
ncbi:hypothetical protein V8E36_003506 [Tilletia maclaganii]